MKLVAAVIMVMALGACCLLGGQLADGPEISLWSVALWGGAIPPEGSTAMVDLYVMVEPTGTWSVLELDVPYPEVAGVLVDTFWYEYEVPLTGERVTYRYGIDLTVAGTTYTAQDHPELACESEEWWWYFGGSVLCGERER